MTQCGAGEENIELSQKTCIPVLILLLIQSDFGQVLSYVQLQFSHL